MKLSSIMEGHFDKMSDLESKKLDADFDARSVQGELITSHQSDIHIDDKSWIVYLRYSETKKKYYAYVLYDQSRLHFHIMKSTTSIDFSVFDKNYGEIKSAMNRIIAEIEDNLKSDPTLPKLLTLFDLHILDLEDVLQS